MTKLLLSPLNSKRSGIYALFSLVPVYEILSSNMNAFSTKNKEFKTKKKNFVEMTTIDPNQNSIF